jgi:A/G-specific adenine glycosylase
MNIPEFRNTVYSFYEKAGRKMPWRENVFPWGVMVSEFMLQQAKAEKVILFWDQWMNKWPELKDFANATMEDVNIEWCKFGNNNRGYALKRSSEMLLRYYGGRIPGVPHNLLPLPGIGPYIAGAITCFGYNYPSVFTEMNIRCAVKYCFSRNYPNINNNEIKLILHEALDRKNPRKWYYALMDYGYAIRKRKSYLTGQKSNYVKKPVFTAEFQPVRRKALNSLISNGPSTFDELFMYTHIDTNTLYNVITTLKNESLVSESKGLYKFVY